MGHNVEERDSDVSVSDPELVQDISRRTIHNFSPLLHPQEKRPHAMMLMFECADLPITQEVYFPGGPKTYDWYVSDPELFKASVVAPFITSPSSTPMTKESTCNDAVFVFVFVFVFVYD